MRTQRKKPYTWLWVDLLWLWGENLIHVIKVFFCFDFGNRIIICGKRCFNYMNDIIHNLALGRPRVLGYHQRVPEISRGFTWVNSGSSGTSIRHPSSSVRCRCSLLSLYFAMRSRSFITYNGMTGIHYTYQMQGKINDAIFELYALIIVYLTHNYPLF